MGKRFSLFFGIAMLAVLSIPSVALGVTRDSMAMYRLYNPNTGEHFYTASNDESFDLELAGWTLEGVGWFAPSEGPEVYRLYNPNAPGGDHHYTTSPEECDVLVRAGWVYEGVGWRTASAEGAVSLHRLYNPNAATGTHHYTPDAAERDRLVSLGWRYEGIGWYGVSENEAAVDYLTYYVEELNERGWGATPAEAREDLELINKLILYNGFGFSSSSIEYAFENAQIDWGEQAVKDVRDFCFIGMPGGEHWSRRELQDHLLRGGFTEEQAAYGIKHGVRSSFSTAAARRADVLLNPSYTANPPKTRDETVERLLGFGFELSEAEYGADHKPDGSPRAW